MTINESEIVFFKIATLDRNNIYEQEYLYLLAERYTAQARAKKWHIRWISEFYAPKEEAIISEIKGTDVFRILQSENKIQQANKYERYWLINQISKYFRIRNKPECLNLILQPNQVSARVNVILQPNLEKTLPIKSQELKIIKKVLNPGYGVKVSSFSILHKPTKIKATICDRFSRKNLAMRLLIAKLYTIQLQQNIDN